MRTPALSGIVIAWTLLIASACTGGDTPTTVEPNAPLLRLAGAWQATQVTATGEQVVLRLVFADGWVTSVEFSDKYLIDDINGLRRYEELALPVAVMGETRERILLDVAGGMDLWRIDVIDANRFQLGNMRLVRSDGALPAGTAVVTRVPRGGMPPASLAITAPLEPQR